MLWSKMIFLSCAVTTAMQNVVRLCHSEKRLHTCGLSQQTLRPTVLSYLLVTHGTTLFLRRVRTHGSSSGTECIMSSRSRRPTMWLPTFRF
ncbi:hypothetical protein EDD17DRAFT_924209 [Pisolithus thermaeus]|nr:hypothetical protein EDD17DRAFT_924209 [Pisolithus thermaeus]